MQGEALRDHLPVKNSVVAAVVWMVQMKWTVDSAEARRAVTWTEARNSHSKKQSCHLEQAVKAAEGSWESSSFRFATLELLLVSADAVADAMWMKKWGEQVTTWLRRVVRQTQTDWESNMKRDRVAEVMTNGFEIRAVESSDEQESTNDHLGVEIVSLAVAAESMMIVTMADSKFSIALPIDTPYVAIG